MIQMIGNFQNKLHLDQVAKNASRLGQNFSSSLTFQFSQVNVVEIEDRMDSLKNYYTDGIGCISEDLIK